MAINNPADAHGEPKSAQVAFSCVAGAGMAAAQYAMMAQMPAEVVASLFMPAHQDGSVPAMPPCGDLACDGVPREFFAI